MKRGLILMMALATVMAMAEAQVEIRLNQVGYYPMEQKAVVVEGADPTGVLTVEDSKGKTVLRPTAVKEVKASPPPPSLFQKKRRILVVTDFLTIRTYP